MLLHAPAEEHLECLAIRDERAGGPVPMTAPFEEETADALRRHLFEVLNLGLFAK